MMEEGATHRHQRIFLSDEQIGVVSRTILSNWDEHSRRHTTRDLSHRARQDIRDLVEAKLGEGQEAAQDETSP